MESRSILYCIVETKTSSFVHSSLKMMLVLLPESIVEKLSIVFALK